jgi:exodeoxyribonuclease-5
MTGYVEKIYRESYNKRTMKMDFRPDFMKKFYKNLEFNYYHMYAPPGDPEDERREEYMFMYDKFEYSYAISTHKSQGSAWNNVLFLYEDFMNTDEGNKKLLYTGITMAIEQLTVVMP